MDVYILDKDLNRIGLIDTYTSLIWSKRYRENGDCELYVPATIENFELLKMGFYITRPDDDMVCKIRKIELDTNAENGNYLIVTGYDVKSFLDQRIIWGTATAKGNLEDFIRNIFSDNIGANAPQERQFVNSGNQRFFNLGTAAGLDEVSSEQTSYKNIGEKIRECCQRYGWGYRVYKDGNNLLFTLYKGRDKTQEVVFSDDFENLSETKYTEDQTNLGNVALIAGEGEGAARFRCVYGEADGEYRFEKYVDAKDVSKTITWDELTQTYPTQAQGGYGYIVGTEETGYFYRMEQCDILIITDAQLAALQSEYPSGQEVTIDGVLYYRIFDENIADLTSEAPEDSDEAVLSNSIYEVYLLTRGFEHLAEFGALKSFEGSIEPSSTFVYKTDYDLGDLVTVKNEYGISVEARITEIIEVSDDNGYSVEPKFEYVEE